MQMFDRMIETMKLKGLTLSIGPHNAPLHGYWAVFYPGAQGYFDVWDSCAHASSPHMAVELAFRKAAGRQIPTTTAADFTGEPEYVTDGQALAFFDGPLGESYDPAQIGRPPSPGKPCGQGIEEEEILETGSQEAEEE